MSTSTLASPPTSAESLPLEWSALKDRVRRMPASIRAELEPIVDDALDQARFRSRVLTVARDALEQLQLDLKLTRFDLDLTRQEREDLRRQLEAAD